MASSNAPLCLVRSSINIDDTFSVSHIVRPGETISSSSLVSRAGGKGANVSAAIGLAGAAVHLCGAVGQSADWPLAQLEKRGVNVESVARLDDVPTGRAIIQIAQNGENSIVLLKGANFHDVPQLSNPSTVFASLPRPPTHVVLQNEIPLPQTRSFLTYAHAQGGITTIFNPSPMPTPSELRTFEWQALHVLIVNEGEAIDLLAALGEEASKEGAQAEDILSSLDALPAFANLEWLVMTRGAKGVLASVQLSSTSASEHVKGKSKRQHFACPAFKPRHVKDTTGAGDTFAGNLVAALMRAQQQHQGEAKGLQKEDVQNVLTWAGMAAALAVEKEGALDSIPKREEVKARIDSEE